MQDIIQLKSRIENHQATIGVIGLGYVGLPLLMEFCRVGFPVLGFDLDRSKVDSLLSGSSYIKHIPSPRIAEMNTTGRFEATTDFDRLKEVNVIIICVPTPLTRQREPDMSYIVNTGEVIQPRLQKNQLIILESTTYPGTTKEVLKPILEKKGYRAGEDFFLAFSPEREDPGNPTFSTSKIPKVVGGYNPESLELANALYSQIVVRTVPVSSLEIAEAVKLTENIFRSINIAMVNELKMIYDKMGIDVWEVIEAAKTKPFGYMPFYPGPGLGGHCIPIDPFYLTWKAREFESTTRFIELAGEINTSMPHFVLEKTLFSLNDQRKALKGSKVLLVGLSYKQNVDDDRESPTYALWDLLSKRGAEVSYYDPFCPVVRPTREHAHYAGIESVKFDHINADHFDAAIIVTAHECVDHDAIAAAVPLVIDTRNACKPAKNVVKA